MFVQLTKIFNLIPLSCTNSFFFIFFIKSNLFLFFPNCTIFNICRYVIAVLCIVKIYQFRHPDVSSNAYKIFTGISVVILLEVTGIFNGSTLFWIVLTIFYIIFIMMLSTILYRVDKWKRPWQQVTLFYFVSNFSFG